MKLGTVGKHCSRQTIDVRCQGSEKLKPSNLGALDGSPYGLNPVSH